MNDVPGTKGYENVVVEFIEASQALSFSEVNKDFLQFLPPVASRVLDAGAGAGQNAAALARLGHRVVGVEPMPAFINAARATYAGLDITWVDDSLPFLKKLGTSPGQYDFILLDGVWHHLDEEERAHGMVRLATLLNEAGVCAISLRNGPAGAGTHVFTTDGQKTAALASECGLEVVLHLTDQPSVMKNKPGVTFTRMVFRKCWI